MLNALKNYFNVCEIIHKKDPSIFSKYFVPVFGDDDL
jgi:hypothetical protein